MHIGILCAMPEEVGSSLDNLINKKINVFGDLTIYSGIWNNPLKKETPIYVSIAWSGWGKVSSARAATRIIQNKYKDESINQLFFIGVAGAIDPKLNQRDIIIANKLFQHDMDASPIFHKYVIPALNKEFIEADIELFKWTYETLSQAKSEGNLKDFGDIYAGQIATGDKFVNDQKLAELLKFDFPDLLGVEMEGGAVAQVCYQEKIPCQIVRVVSDNANNSSDQDFNEFLKAYEKNSSKLVKILIDNLNTSSL